MTRMARMDRNMERNLSGAIHSRGCGWKPFPIRVIREIRGSKFGVRVYGKNGRNPFTLRRRWIEKCLRLAEASVALSAPIKSRALALEQAGFKALDALHLACAEAAGAETFLTCDDRLIRRYSGQMMVQSPVTFTTDLT